MMESGAAVTEAQPEAPPDPIVVALHTFIAHGDLGSRGLSCVVTNRSPHPVKVHVGYDGKHNLLLASTGTFPVALRPMLKRETRIAVVEPGMSETIFTLSLHEILLRNGEADRAKWKWGWGHEKPRGAPPISPIHPRAGRDWMLTTDTHTDFTAEANVDGRVVVSPPLSYRAVELNVERRRAP